MHIAQGETGRRGNRVFNQGGPIRNAGHALTGLVEGQALTFVMRAKQGHGIGAMGDGHAKGGRNRISSDIVMRRTDAAAGEEMVMGPAQGIHRCNDRPMVIGDHARLGQTDADPRQFAGQIMHVAVAGPAGQDLIPDDQHRGGGVRHDVPP